ncbi:MAG: hypothetical protein SchgKO_15530 [Schleiferiaceae bacterium]
MEIVGIDMSITPELRASGYELMDENGHEVDPVAFLQSKGVNTVRLRLWNEDADIAEKSQFATELHSRGINVLLCLHYSDTWADPGHQNPPSEWQGLEMPDLLDSVYFFTAQMVQLFQPEYVQIGNEINSGILHPQGHIDSTENFHNLLSAGIRAVRDVAPSTQVILHYAGVENADYFYTELDTLDYDLAGLSYYPMWHGKDVNMAATKLLQFETAVQKPWFIAETSYPFTLSWNDWTHNLLGDESQLALGYPATPQGQVGFIEKIKSAVRTSNYGLGYCYWAGDWVAFNGPESTEGSPVENQAYFNFSGGALPIVNHLD